MPVSRESITLGEVQGSSALNWSKVGAVAVFIAIGVRLHTQRYFLRRDELKEGTALGGFADYFRQLIGIGTCVIVGVGYYTKQQPLHGQWTLDEGLALGISASALFLRFWAIKSLDQFFTYRVGIRKGHRLIRSGPYFLLRHPSYTGTILAFGGVGYFAGLRTWTTLVPFIAAVTGLFCIRLFDEENVLLDAFGQECKDYFKATWRLVPYLF